MNVLPVTKLSSQDRARQKETLVRPAVLLLIDDTKDRDKRK